MTKIPIASSSSHQNAKSGYTTHIALVVDMEWNVKANWSRFAMMAVAIAMAVVTCVSVVQNWDKMNSVDRGLNYASIIQ